MNYYQAKAIFFPLLIFSAFCLNSCRKADRDTDTSTEMVRDNSRAVFLFNNIYRQLHQLALSDSLLNSFGFYNFPDTACIDTVTHTNILGSFPDTITVRFKTGSTCADGYQKAGRIKFILSGKYGTYLKNYTIIPENFYINDYLFEGQMEVSCRGKNSSGFNYFAVTVNDGLFTNDTMRQEFYSPYPGQSSAIQLEWLSGEGTAVFTDDIFQLSGSYGGAASKGTVYKCEIATGLKIQSDCRWITSGKEKLTPLNLSPRETDYGSGCDNAAKVKINGKEFDVSLLP